MKETEMRCKLLEGHLWEKGHRHLAPRFSAELFHQHQQQTTSDGQHDSFRHHLELVFSKLKAKYFHTENPKLTSPNRILRIQYPVGKI